MAKGVTTILLSEVIFKRENLLSCETNNALFLYFSIN